MIVLMSQSKNRIGYPMHIGIYKYNDKKNNDVEIYKLVGTNTSGVQEVYGRFKSYEETKRVLAEIMEVIKQDGTDSYYEVPQSK